MGRRLWNTDKNNWAPRLGFAWKPCGSQRWVVRGGYGVYYNLQNIGNTMAGLNRGLPFRLRQRFDNTSAFSASTFTLTDPFPDAMARNTLSPPAIGPNFRTAYMQQWSLGLQRKLFKDLNQCAAACGARPFSDWSDIVSRMTLQSGSPFSVLMDTSKNASGTFGFADRPNLVGDPFSPGPYYQSPLGVRSPPPLLSPNEPDSRAKPKV